jgi:hypothetical protein
VAVSSSSKLIQELHSTGLVEANADALRPDMTRDLPRIEKSGVLPWKESWRGLGLSVRLSALSPTIGSVALRPAFCAAFVSELGSNPTLLSLAFRRLKQANTRSRNALPPMANAMAVAMLIIDLSLGEASVGVGCRNGIELADVVGHGVMSEATPQSPLLLPYLKPCRSPNSPVMTSG